MLPKKLKPMRKVKTVATVMTSQMIFVRLLPARR